MLNAHCYTQTDTVPTSVPEEGLGRDGVDEPLKQLARSLPAVVDFCQVCEKSLDILTVSTGTLLLLLLILKHKDSISE